VPVNKDINILVVDDSLGIRLAVKKMFNKLGFENIELADDGTTALEIMKDQLFDLVVVDWSMPTMSGIEMVQEMKKSDRLKDIPALLVTADEEQETIMTALRAGINNYMKKPYESKVIIEKINQIFKFQEKQRQRNS